MPSRFEGNREFATKVQSVLWQARSAYQDYQEGKLSRLALSEQRETVEASLNHPEVKPDNNDADVALRPIVIHRFRQWWCQKRLGSRVSRPDV